MKKEEGNTAFKAGNLDEAYKLYRYNRNTLLAINV